MQARTTPLDGRELAEGSWGQSEPLTPTQPSCWALGMVASALLAVCVSCPTLPDRLIAQLQPNAHNSLTDLFHPLIGNKCK